MTTFKIHHHNGKREKKRNGHHSEKNKKRQKIKISLEGSSDPENRGINLHNLLSSLGGGVKKNVLVSHTGKRRETEGRGRRVLKAMF